MSFFARALRHRNFRLYFTGQLVSFVGTWMQQVAMGWLVYRLTGSVLLLGVIGFASQIPILIFAPFGGVLSDRFNRHRLLVLSQSLAMLQAFILAALTLSGWVQVWHLILMSGMLGLINALDAPARQSFVVFLVDDRADMPNAIALNSFAINTARLIGPAAAGLIVGYLSEGMCFLLNGLSYLAVLLALLKIRVDIPPRRHTPSLLGGLKAGIAYTASHRPIRALLLLAAVLSLTVAPYIVLMPYYAKEVFHGDAKTLGLLMSCSGIGALTGSAFLASRKSVAGLGSKISKTAGLAGAGLMLFAPSHYLWPSMALAAVMGFGLISTAAATNTLIQSLVAEEYRGRVMSLFTMSFMGMAPLGNLSAGALAHWIGVPATLFAGGAVTVICSLLLARPLAGVGEHLEKAEA